MDAELLVLAGIAPDRIDRLEKAQLKLRPEHFRQGPYRKLWTLVSRYYDQTGGVIPHSLISDLANRTRSIDPGEALLLAEHYALAVQETVSEDRFRYGILALIETLASETTGQALADAIEILDRGRVERRRGEDVTLRGYSDAWDYLFEAHGGITAAAASEAAPEGDVREEERDILAEYAKAKEQGDKQHVLWGLPTLDAVTGGLNNGELIVVGGYTGTGKSQMVTQLAWHTAVKQGKNVYFATSETSRLTARRRLLSRHSLEPQFGLPLNNADVKNGTLTHAGEQMLAKVARDMATNPSYGKLHVAQVPAGATMSHLGVMMARAERQWKIDLIVIDYVALLTPERRRTSEREEMNEKIRAAKNLATTFADGRGVPVLTPWAVTRSAWREALDPKGQGGYTLDSLADTSEIEKSADSIFTLLANPASPGRVTQQVLKNRDGAVPPPSTLQADYRYAKLEEQAAADLADFASSEEDSDDLLKAL